MKITRRGFELTVENSVVFSDKSSQRAFIACTQCECESTMVSPDAAARIAHITTREIYRLIEKHRVHFSEAAGGQTWVCMSSVLARET